MKPWSTTISLGKKILEELNQQRGTDTTARWLAHLLAEKIELATSAPDNDEGESIRKQCLELILQIWERRERFPLAIPLASAIQDLNTLLKPKSYFPASETSKSPTLELFRKLIQFHKQESQVCFALWISQLDLSLERAHITDNPEHLSDDELRVASFLVESQDELSGDNAKVCGKTIPDFGSLPDKEKEAICHTILKEIAEKRSALL
ncbi:hypothetical protein [Pseudomonas chlororaphis]